MPPTANPTTHRPTTSNQIDYSKLSPEAQQILREYFATHPVQLTHHGRTQHSRVRPSQRCLGDVNGAIPSNIDSGKLPPEARKMILDFFADHDRQGNAATTPRNQRRGFTNAKKQHGTPSLGPTNGQSHNQRRSATPGTTVIGHVSYLPGKSHHRAFTRTSRQANANNHRPQAGAAAHGSFAWVHNPELRLRVIRAIGRQIQQEQAQPHHNRPTSNVPTLTS